MGHYCHATGCVREVPPSMFACPQHWRALPARLRREVWASYRDGQCDDWQISHRYANAARAACRFFAALDDVTPDFRVWDALDPGPSQPCLPGLSEVMRPKRQK